MGIMKPVKVAAGRMWLHGWENIGLGDEAEPAEIVFDRATVQVTGEFGGGINGCHMRLEASIDGKTFGPISQLGFRLTSRDNSVFSVNGPFHLLRPVIIGANEKTKVSVYIGVLA